jgi:hypothetical protein
LHLEFTLIFTTNFVGSLDIRASREVFPIGVRSPEIRQFHVDRDSLVNPPSLHGLFWIPALRSAATGMTNLVVGSTINVAYAFFNFFLFILSSDLGKQDRRNKVAESIHLTKAF